MKNYVIVNYDKILEDRDLRFVVINMFSKKAISLADSTIDNFVKVAQESKLIFLSNARKEDLAVQNGLFKNRDDAKKAGVFGEFSSGLSKLGSGNSTLCIYKPVR